MHIHRDIVGNTDTAEVESFLLDNGHGLAVEVWTYGATLVQVLVPDRDGRRDNVVVRLPDLAAYQRQRAYVGATVGRYCRSVAGGRFQLDGVEHQLSRNDGRHHVHGGVTGFDRLVWRAETELTEERAAVWLHLDSPHGAEGYPGALSVTAGFAVDRDNRLELSYRATTDAPTVVGLTNHAFWNLAGTGTVDDHWLRIDSTRVVPFDDELIPLPGPPRDILGTGLDHTTARLLTGTRLDTMFVLDDPAWAAELTHPASGRRMRVRTDQPGLGTYTGDHYERPRAGICLECGPWPDAPRRPDFPPVRLDPGAEYRHVTVHEFGVG